MTTTKTAFDPYSVTLISTSDYNLFYALSSDGYSVYAVYFHSENEVTCTCEGFEKYHENCHHRKAAIARYGFITPLDDTLDNVTWTAIQNRIEDAAELEAFETMMSEAA